MNVAATAVRCEHVVALVVRPVNLPSSLADPKLARLASASPIHARASLLHTSFLFRHAYLCALVASPRLRLNLSVNDCPSRFPFSELAIKLPACSLLRHF